jgi:hypothetical protein
VPDQFNIYDDYRNILTSTMDWRIERDRMRKFYFGQQIGSAISAEYKDRGQVDIVINKIRPLLRSRVSMLVASKPTGSVYGVKKKDMSTAYAIEEFMDFHFYNSTGQLVMEDVAMFSQREGLSYFIVYLDPNAAYGMGELKFGHESYENVFVKKSAREWDFADAGRVIHSRLVNPDDFLNRNSKYFKISLDELLRAFSHPYDIPTSDQRQKGNEQKDIGQPVEDYTGDNAHYIREFDVYDRVYIDVPILHNLVTNTIEVLKDDYKVSDNENRFIREGVLRQGIGRVPRIWWTKAVGNGAQTKVLKRLLLPIEHFPLVPVHDERTGNAQSLGETDFYAGLQEMQNQATSLVLLHAALASMFKIIYDSGKVKDSNKFREEWSTPGSAIGLPFDKVTGKPPVEIVRPEPINNAFFTLMREMGAEMEYEAMQNPMSWGSTKEAPETFSATLQIHEWAQNALRLPLNHLEIAVQRAYEIMIQWSREFYGFRTFDVMRGDTPDTNFVNSPIPYPAKDRSGKDIVENGQVVMTHHDIRSLRARYRVRIGSTAPSQSVAYMNLYQQLSQNHPVFLKQFVQYLDIPPDEKNELIQSVDLVAQQGSTIQQQEQLIKMLQKTISNISKENLDLEKRHKVDRFEGMLIKKMAKIEANLAKMTNDLKFKGEKEIQDAKNKIKKSDSSDNT